MASNDQKYPGYRFPIEIISHSVWLYHRFMLSLRDVTEILLSRGIEVSHESIREWGFKFGSEFAKGIRKRSPRRPTATIRVKSHHHIPNLSKNH